MDFHSSTTYLQSQKFLELVTTLKYFFQSVQKYCRAPVVTISNLVPFNHLHYLDLLISIACLFYNPFCYDYLKRLAAEIILLLQNYGPLSFSSN